MFIHHCTPYMVKCWTIWKYCLRGVPIVYGVGILVAQFVSFVGRFIVICLISDYWLYLRIYSSSSSHQPHWLYVTNLTGCTSICTPASLAVHQSVHQPHWLYIKLYTSLTGCTSNCTPASLAVHQSVHQPHWLYITLYTSLTGCTSICTV